MARRRDGSVLLITHSPDRPRGASTRSSCWRRPRRRPRPPRRAARRSALPGAARPQRGIARARGRASSPRNGARKRPATLAPASAPPGRRRPVARRRRGRVRHLRAAGARDGGGRHVGLAAGDPAVLEREGAGVAHHVDPRAPATRPLAVAADEAAVVRRQPVDGGPPHLRQRDDAVGGVHGRPALLIWPQSKDVTAAPVTISIRRAAAPARPRRSRTRRTPPGGRPRP